MKLTWMLLIIAAGVTGCRDQNALLWEIETPRPAFAGDSEMFEPRVVGDVAVYCGGYGWGRQGKLAAVALSDGSPRWAHTVGWCQAAPLIADSIAVGFGSQPDHTALAAADLESGRLLWELKLPRYATAPIAQGGVLYLHVADTLLRISARSGTAERIVVPACSNRPNLRPWLAAGAERALLGCGDSVFALSAQGVAEPLLELSEPIGRPEFVALIGDRLYLANAGVPSIKQFGGLAVFQLSDGKLLWKREWRKILSSVHVAGETLYVNVSAPEWALLALDAATGEERWRSRIRSFAAPRIIADRLFATDGAAVVVIDPRSGEVLRRFRSSAEVSSTPVLAGDRVLFGNLRGVLSAIRRDF